jgi:mono/diheme cytochrome c family protein
MVRKTITESTVAAIVPFALAAVFTSAPAAADVPEEIAAPINEKYSVDIKKIFATNCSLCHGAYGMQAGGRGGGPKVAGTAKSRDEVVERIAHGKQGLMPPFDKVLKEEQIQALADYIKALPK